MPINLSLSPALDKRSPVGISSLIDSLRSRSAIVDPLKLADALDQLQQGLQAVMRALREPPATTGDQIQITDSNGALGLSLSSGSITLSSGGFTLLLTPTVVDVGVEYHVNGSKVLGGTIHGWTPPTATPSRAALPNGATLAQVIGNLAGVITDLTTQGIIGA